MTDHYDVIVIGSGAGGGTLTYALAPTGKRILLLERGDFLPREPQNWDSKSVWVDLRYHNSGNWTDADTGDEFPPKQNYYVGGNTKVYGAILFRFRERDFRRIQHVDGVSPPWPLTYADFEPWYTRAEHLYHVYGQRGADPSEPPSAAPYRYPPLSHEPRIAVQLTSSSGLAAGHRLEHRLGFGVDEDEVGGLGDCSFGVRDDDPGLFVDGRPLARGRLRPRRRSYRAAGAARWRRSARWPRSGG